jgi:aryl-alcohol dehydrogenase-like predicted oxidoreductase
MRYRPFGRSGQAVSAVACVLTPDLMRKGPAFFREYVYAALEAGVNTFQVTEPSDALAGAVGDALSAVERRLVFVALTLEATLVAEGPQSVRRVLQTFLRASGLERLDLVVLDNPAALSHDVTDLLRALKSAGHVRTYGIARHGQCAETEIASDLFDVLVAPYNLTTGWRERNIIKNAVANDMLVLSCDYYPEALRDPKGVAGSSSNLIKGLFGGKTKSSHPLAGAGTYDFLHKTRGWTAEELCLAFALTEPSVAAVLVEARDPAAFARLAQAAERDLPSSIPAQAEMARFSASA